MPGVTGILEYPESKDKQEVYLSQEDKSSIEEKIQDIHAILQSERCPDTKPMKICRKCAYYDFCYIGEAEEEGE